MATDVKDSASLSAPSDANEITRSNQLNSPLLRLPGEIRNRIYEYVFFGSEMIVKHSRHFDNALHQDNNPFHVLAACQQIRHEATSILWNECIINVTTFNCISDYDYSGVLSDCTRITSLVVNWQSAHELRRSKVLKRFSKLRKIYVQLESWGSSSVLYMDSMRRTISAMGLQVELRKGWYDEDLGVLVASSA